MTTGSVLHDYALTTSIVMQRAVYRFSLSNISMIQD